MIRKLVWEGIGIETNPSSNYLIGTIQKYKPLYDVEDIYEWIDYVRKIWEWNRLLSKQD